MKRHEFMPAALVGVFAALLVLAAIVQLPPQSTPAFCSVEEWQHG